MDVIFGNAKITYYQRKDGRWSLNWKEADKRRTSTLKGTESEAKTKARKIAKRINKGIGGVTITHEEAETLNKLKELSKATGKSCLQLIDEVKTANPQKITALFSEFYKNMETLYKVDRSKSDRTWKSINDELKAFENKYPYFMVNDITSEFLAVWCDRNSASEQTQNNRVTIWRTFFNHARQRKEYPFPISPADEVIKKAIPTKIPPVFELTELPKIFKFLTKDLNLHNRKNHLTAFAIAVWAGARPSEIQRLMWSHIDLNNNYIHADHNICRKLRHERYIPIHPCLLFLLKQLKPDKDAQIITPNAWRTLIRRLKESKTIKAWPEDITRHSYISYRLAHTKNAAAVADECGNSEEIIKTKYRKPIKPQDGKKWFSQKIKL